MAGAVSPAGLSTVPMRAPLDPTSFRTRLVGGLGLLMLVLAGAWAWRSWHAGRSAVEREERSRIAAVAWSLGSWLDGTAHEELIAELPDRGAIDDWREASSGLRVMRGVLADAVRMNGIDTPIATLRLREGFRGAVSREPERVHARAMELMLSTDRTPSWRWPCDYIPEMGPVLFRGRHNTTEVYRDPKGTWLSAFAPVVSRDGDIVALVEVDSRLDPLLARATQKLASELTFGGGLLLLALAGTILLCGRMTASLSALELAARRFADGDLVTPVRAPGKVREVAALAGALEAAREHLAAHLIAAERMRIELERARDQAEEGMRARSRFLANMGHELRTPLHGVLGALQLVDRERLDPGQAELFDLAESSSRSLLLFLDHVLEYTRLEAGDRAPARVDFDLGAVIERAAASARAAARERGLDFRVEVAPDLPARVSGEEQCLRRVLVELLDNAVKFTERGAIALRVERSAEQGSPTLLRFEVVDAGIGIAPAAREALFEPFRQADDSSTRAFGGVGLGLAIVRLLCRILGGEVGCESEPGRGSRFWFTASFAPPREPAPLPRLPARGNGTPGPGVRLLVVEDNPVNQRVVQRMLERLGYRAEVAQNGQEALDAVVREEFDGILMDCQMPVMDGYEATARIRRNGGPGAAIPIIALTAHSSKENRALALQAGMDDFVSKPVRLETIRAVLCRWLARGADPGE